jgi:peptide/nickel transport system substrate-binding protein
VAAAEGLLDQAGWAKGPDGVRAKAGKPLTLDLHFEPTWAPLDKPTAELLAQRWRAIGVTVKLSGDATNVGNRVMFETGDYDVFLLGFNPNLPSILHRFVSGPVPPKGSNIAGIKNADYDALSFQAEAIVPPGACPYWSRAEQALINDVDVVPISNRPWLYYLKNAQAQVVGYQLPAPTTIRVLK